MDWSTYDFLTPLSKLIQETTSLPESFRLKMADINNWTKIALWDLFEGTEDEQIAIKAIIEPLYQSREFFLNLRPYPWIVDLVHELEKDKRVFFCTKPSKNAECDSEWAKRESIIRDFWPAFSQRIIMAHDKTMIRWDILIDDNPHIYWDYKPEWKQILVDQPHNQHSKISKLYVDRVDLWKEQIEEVLLQTA